MAGSVTVAVLVFTGRDRHCVFSPTSWYSVGTRPVTGSTGEQFDGGRSSAQPVPGRES